MDKKEIISAIVDLIEDLAKDIAEEKIAEERHRASECGDEWYSFPESEKIKEKLTEKLTELLSPETPDIGIVPITPKSS